MNTGPEQPPLTSMLQAARHFIENEHPLFKSLGLVTKRLAKGDVCFQVKVPVDYTDGDVVHGGIYTIILDTILGYATWTSLDELCPIATINLKTDHFRPIPPDTEIICTGTCEGIREDVAYCTGRANLADSGELLAMAAGTFMVGTRPCRALTDATPFPTFWKTVEEPLTLFCVRTVSRSFVPCR